MTYNEFINDIISTRGQWSDEVRYSSRGCEKHHIVPKCMGGLPKKLDWSHHENVIWLYPSEHYIAHKLLALENSDNYSILCAWNYMHIMKSKTHEVTISENEYEELRVKHSIKNSEAHIGKSPSNKGVSMSDEQKLKLSLAKQGRKMPDKFVEECKIRNKLGRNPTAKKIICINTGEIFNCIKEASLKYNINYSNLKAHLKGFVKPPMGLTFEYYYGD